MTTPEDLYLTLRKRRAVNVYSHSAIIVLDQFDKFVNMMNLVTGTT